MGLKSTSPKKLLKKLSSQLIGVRKAPSREETDQEDAAPFRQSPFVNQIRGSKVLGAGLCQAGQQLLTDSPEQESEDPLWALTLAVTDLLHNNSLRLLRPQGPHLPNNWSEQFSSLVPANSKYCDILRLVCFWTESASL